MQPNPNPVPFILPYGVAPSPLRNASWIMLLVMGIVNLFLGSLTALGFLAQLYTGIRRIVPDTNDFVRLLIAVGVMALLTPIAGCIYCWASHAVNHGSRAAASLARLTAILMAVSYAALAAMEPVLLSLRVLHIHNMLVFVGSLTVRLSLLAANCILAWVLSRRLAQMPSSPQLPPSAITPPPAPPTNSQP